MAAYGRIGRDCILISDPTKPLPRAAKGTIQRAATYRLYAEEIDQLYRRLEGSGQSAAQEPQQQHFMRSIDLSDCESTQNSIQQFLAESLHVAPQDIDPHADFFSMGMDSLQVVNLVRASNAALQGLSEIEAKQVYDHASVIALTRFLHTEVLSSDNGKSTTYFANPEDDSDDEELHTSWMTMDKMYRDIALQLDEKSHQHPSRCVRWLRSLSPMSSNDDTTPVYPPDGGVEAWSQVLAMFLVNINNWGLVNSFGVFQTFYSSQYLPNVAPSTIAWIGTLQGSLLLIVGVVSGPLYDMGLFKPMLVLSSLGLVFGWMMLSLSTQFYQILLAQGLLCGLCSGLLYVPSIALVPIYFKRRRGLAIGLATGGGAFGGIIYPIIFQKLLDEAGFPWAVRAMGFIALLTLGTAVFLTKPISKRTFTRQLVDSSAIQEPPFVFIMIAGFFLLAAAFVPYFQSVNFSKSLHGNRTTTSTSLYPLAVVNAAQFVGRVVSAGLTDLRYNPFFGPEALLFFSEAAMAVLGFAWIAVNNNGGLISWLLIYGFFSGAAVTLPALVLPHLCSNMAVYGTRLGMLYGVAGLGFFVSFPVASALIDNGSFLGTQLWTGACCAVATLLFAPAGWQVRRNRMLYENRRRRRGQALKT